MMFAARGRSASGGPAPCFGRNDRATTTAVAAPIRPTSSSASGKSRRRGFATVIVVSTCCSGVKAGRSTASGASMTLGHGLRPWPAGNRTEAADSHRRRHVQPVLAGGRTAVPLPSTVRDRGARAVCAKVGYPASIRVRQGSDFISRELDLWAYVKGVTLDLSRPGKPTDNAFIESFNGKFRAECLNAHWFMSLDDAVRKSEAWRRDYNEVRPHSAIGNKPSISLLPASVAHGSP